MAKGFGGGIGRKGSLCGALPDSGMAIGMRMGRIHSEDKESFVRVYGRCQGFWDRFEKEFGNHLCFHLAGFRLDQEEERKNWLASGGIERCRSIVEKTAKMLCEFIEEG